MARRAEALLLALALSGCAGGGPAASPAAPTASPTPILSPPLPVRAACTDTPAPASVSPGASFAVLAQDDHELTLFLIEDLTGCWIRLDPSESPISISALALHPSGRFVFASGVVAPDRPGVAAYAIVPERAALDGLGASWMEQQASDFPGSLVATERAVYMLSGGRHTGQHGGMWRWAFDPADGGLTWRGRAYALARDPFFLVHGLDDEVIYLGTESLEDGFTDVAVAMDVGRDGALTPAAQTPIETISAAVADPAGTFFWIAAGSRSAARRLHAYRPAASGALGRPESAEWGRRVPVPHPRGRVLYTASPTHVEAYAVDPLRGTPRLVSQAAYAGADVLPMAVHPDGTFLYVAARDEVHAFRTDADGRLEEYGRVAPGGTHMVTVRPR